METLYFNNRRRYIELTLRFIFIIINHLFLHHHNLQLSIKNSNFKVQKTMAQSIKLLTQATMINNNSHLQRKNLHIGHNITITSLLHQNTVHHHIQAAVHYTNHHFMDYGHVMNIPYMILYIPWKYNNELDPLYQEMVTYFVKTAIKRGYNYFSLQKIHVHNELHDKSSGTNFTFLYEQLLRYIEKECVENNEKGTILVHGELVFNCVTREFIKYYGGFFLIAKLIDPQSKVFKKNCWY